MKIHKNLIYSLTCDCGESINITKIEDATSKDWKIQRLAYSSDLDTEIKSIRKIRCPDCNKKEKIKKYNSPNFIDRLYGSTYYNDNPKNFKNDALEHLNVQDNPKANMLYSKAYESGHSSGFAEIFNYMQDLVELIK